MHNCIRCELLLIISQFQDNHLVQSSLSHLQLLTLTMSAILKKNYNFRIQQNKSLSLLRTNKYKTCVMFTDACFFMAWLEITREMLNSALWYF